MTDETTGQLPVEESKNPTVVDNGAQADSQPVDGGETASESSDVGTFENESPVDTASTVIDLRPASDSVKAELIRLGLNYDRTDTNTNMEVWRDYARHLAAEFPHDSGEPVTLTDLRTGISQQLSLVQLRGVSRIIVSGEND